MRNEVSPLPLSLYPSRTLYFDSITILCAKVVEDNRREKSRDNNLILPAGRASDAIILLYKRTCLVDEFSNRHLSSSHYRYPYPAIENGGGS